MNARSRLGGLALLAAMLVSILPAAAQDTVFLSTQLRPVEEATKVRQAILKGSPGPVTYIVEEPPAFDVRVKAEAQAGRRSASLYGALHGELASLVSINALSPLDEIAAKVASRGVPANLMTLGKLGTDRQLYIPWMQATYVMVAHKQALPFLPGGANLNTLTYEQLGAWGKAIRERTNQRRIGFPAGPTGLMHRFFQGSLIPSYTGGVVTPFRSAEAEAAWNALKDIWTSVNPSSTSYNFMQEPLLGGEVWIAFDHVARVLEALRSMPDDFVAFPAPAGPKGRGYMPVIAGLSVPEGAPNRAGALATIDHLTLPRTQLITVAETGFFPVVAADLPPDLPAGVKLAAAAIAAQQSAPDALVSLLPVGLGAKNGEFNKVFLDTFQRIVLRGEPVRAVLDAQGAVLDGIMKETGAPCWAPDAPSVGPCPVR